MTGQAGGAGRTQQVPQSRRWGVILAGGDGRRLLPLTRKLTGDDRPKQFCDVIGGGTLLEHTRRRVATMIGVRQTLVVVTRAHDRFYADLVDPLPTPCLLVQPLNQGTAPAIVYSVLQVLAMDPKALVAFFPSDHYFANDTALARHIDTAFAVAERRADTVVLLGIVPETPEVAYGWIQPGAPLLQRAAGPVYRVARFWEKPDPPLASLLMRRGCLWNSFIMVGRAGAFLRLVNRTLPAVLSAFAPIRSVVQPAAEVLGRVYARIPACGFSAEVLSMCPSQLAVLAGPDLGWSDLGEPCRVHAVLARTRRIS